MSVGETTDLEIATGGDAAAALAAATFGAVEDGSVNIVAIGHDLGCATLDGAGLESCTCELIHLILERIR